MNQIIEEVETSNSSVEIEPTLETTIPKELTPAEISQLQLMASNLKVKNKEKEAFLNKKLEKLKIRRKIAKKSKQINRRLGY